MGHPDLSPATDPLLSDDGEPMPHALASFAAHPGSGRILNVRAGDPHDTAWEASLRSAGYCLGRLPIGRDPSNTPSAAATFAPDVLYVVLTEPAEPGLRTLEVLAQDAKTRTIPLVALVPPDADAGLIEQAYLRSGCDFFRLGATEVELLARTHLLVRLANRNTTAALHQKPVIEAANSPAGSRLDLRDSTTGTYTGTYLRHRLRIETARALRYQRPLSLAAVRCTAAAGSDENARSVAHALLESCRSVDLVARIEQDLFIVVLPETDAEGAGFVRHRIETSLRPLSVTFAIGLASLGADPGHPAFDAEALLHQASRRSET